MRSFFFILVLLWTAHGRAVSEKTLILGDQWLLRGSSRLWVGGRGIISAKPTSNGVLLKGSKEGVVDLRFGDREYLVRVVRPLAARTYDRLQSLCERKVGLAVSWDGPLPVVSGRLYSIKDYLSLVDGLSPDAHWEFRAEVPAGLRPTLEDALAQKLGPEAPVRPLLFDGRPTALFNGRVEAAQRWEKKLGRWGIALRRDENAIEMAPVVRVEIAVAEIRKSKARNLGLKWPSSAEAHLLPDSTWTRPDLIFNAQAFESEGLGRLLARPNILCRSGREAEFVAGGEFPIKILNRRSQDVIWKKYGIVLKVKPKADASGRISLAMETEVSTIDGSRTVDGIPGLLTNRVASHFDLARSRTVVLSGLLKNESTSSREGFPGLSALPILGGLFGSRDWLENRTELVVFVRPVIVQEGQ